MPLNGTVDSALTVIEFLPDGNALVRRADGTERVVPSTDVVVKGADLSREDPVSVYNLASTALASLVTIMMQKVLDDDQSMLELLRLSHLIIQVMIKAKTQLTRARL